VVLALVLLAIVQALAGWLGKKEFTEGNRKVALFAMISAHTQLLLGLALFYFSPLVQFTASTMKDATLRYWTVEHSVMMLPCYSTFLRISFGSCYGCYYAKWSPLIWLRCLTKSTNSLQKSLVNWYLCSSKWQNKNFTTPQ